MRETFWGRVRFPGAQGTGSGWDDEDFYSVG